jgi:hypothetical protein
MNKLLPFFIVVFIGATSLMAQTATQPSGNGTETDPYQISTLENLYWLSQADSIWNDSMFFEQTANIDASDTKNWDSGKGFMPIGDTSTIFKGSYNGKGHVISNLCINRPDSVGVGLFGEIDNAHIDSLGIEHCEISGNFRVGGLVGRSTGSLVSNCFASGNITGAAHNVGGLVGINTYSSTIIDSYANADVSGTKQLGGLTGANFYSSSVINCYATGSATGMVKDIGSLVGVNYSSSEISNSYSTGCASGPNRVGGLTGYNYDNSTITDCYSTGCVSGNENIGGLIGNNSTNCTVESCYSTGSVSGSVQVGGLIGFNNVNSVAGNCYYNKETSGQANGIGVDNNSQAVTGLSTSEMKQYNNFSGFSLVWAMLSNNTYPALQTLDNAPIAFIDTLIASAAVSFEEILANDYDYETGQTALTLKVIGANAGTCSDNNIYFPDTTENGDTIKLTYRVGEIRNVKSDTLWGNMSSAVLIYTNNSAPVVTVDTLMAREDILFCIQNNFIATDVDSDPLNISVLDATVHGDLFQTKDSIKFMPDPDYNGLDSMRLFVSDGILGDTAWVYVRVVAVNDVPVLTLAKDKTVDEDTPLSLTLSDVIANDADGDVLSLIVYAGDNYVVDGNSLTGSLNYNGNLSVSVAVTDGTDTSNIVNMSVVVTAVNDVPVITSTAISSAAVSQTYIYIVTATDPDSDALTYTLSGEPEGMTVTENVIVWTPVSGTTTSGEVTLTVSDGLLSDTETFTVTVAPGTGIHDVTSEGISLYPNPVNKYFSIAGFDGTAVLYLFNNQGKLVLDKEVTAKQDISVAGLAQGTYIARIMLPDKTITKTIIKTK